MSNMSIRRFAVVAFLSAMCTTLLSADDASIARGKYLVDEVAKCGMCHTPNDASGKPDASKYLKGGDMNLQPIQAVDKWHKSAPDITSTSRLWQRWTDAGFVKFLETAAGPTGNHADPPMPAYKLPHDDAQAIADYLKSVK